MRAAVRVRPGKAAVDVLVACSACSGGADVRAGGGPGAGWFRCLAQAMRGEHVVKPSLRVNVIEVGGANQRVDEGGVLAAPIGAGKKR